MNEASPLYSSFIINIVLNAFSAYSAIMLNILTIHAIRKTSSLPKPLKTLLLSLAVSDLGVGLLAQPLFIVRMVNPTQLTSTAYNIFTVTFANASFLTVVAISVDRFLAVHLHLRYQELVTHKRVVALVISIWVLSVSIPLIYLLTASAVFASILLFIIIRGFCFICTTIVYCIIYLVVRRHTNQMQTLQVQVAQNGEMTNFATQTKSAVRTFYVYLVFLVCNLPEYCAVVAFMSSTPSTALRGVYLYSRTMLFVNSSLNPVIYCWKIRHIRQSILEILRSLLPSQN